MEKEERLQSIDEVRPIQEGDLHGGASMRVLMLLPFKQAPRPPHVSTTRLPTPHPALARPCKHTCPRTRSAVVSCSSERSTLAVTSSMWARCACSRVGGWVGGQRLTPRSQAARLTPRSQAASQQAPQNATDSAAQQRIPAQSEQSTTQRRTCANRKVRASSVGSASTPTTWNPLRAEAGSKAGAHVWRLVRGRAGASGGMRRTRIWRRTLPSHPSLPSLPRLQPKLYLRASSTPPRPSAPMAMSTHTGCTWRRLGNCASIFSHSAEGNVFLQGRAVEGVVGGMSGGGSGASSEKVERCQASPACSHHESVMRCSAAQGTGRPGAGCGGLGGLGQLS